MMSPILKSNVVSAMGQPSSLRSRSNSNTSRSSLPGRTSSSEPANVVNPLYNAAMKNLNLTARPHGVRKDKRERVVDRENDPALQLYWIEPDKKIIVQYNC